MKTARFLYGLLALSWVLASSPALAQPMRFATPVESPSSAASTGAPAAAPSSPSVYATPSLSPSAPMVAPGPASSVPAAGPSGSIYTPPPTFGPAPAAPSGAVAQPPASNWDPYATPGNTPSALLQQDPYFQSSPTINMAAVQKFVQHVNLNYDWFAGHPTATNKELGINDVDLNVTFAFPMFRNIERPLLITPGFAVHYWEGPVSVLPAPGGPPPADLPPRTYDAYLDFAWNPQIADYFGAELNFRTGIYSDFNRITSDSIRFMGKGMAVIKLSPHMTVKAGVWYLDRVQVKVLPAGGLVWTPNDDIYFDILFPNPRVGKRLTTWGNTEWWIYGSGDYGGGTWTIKRNTGFDPPVATDGSYTRFDYNDIRIAIGLQFKTLRQLEGHFEVGFACSRELVYQDHSPNGYFPHNTVYLGAGLTY